VNRNTKSFQTFMKRREKAAAGYVSGDPSLLMEMVARDLPATFFGPAGGKIKGATAVARTYERDAGRFSSGSTTEIEVLDLAESNDIAFWTGIQHATAQVKGKADPVPMQLRVTEIFRREDGDWKLVHRHADTLAQPEKT
jgi:ketosteroid isomerase-like protein